MKKQESEPKGSEFSSMKGFLESTRPKIGPKGGEKLLAMINEDISKAEGIISRQKESLGKRTTRLVEPV